MTEPTDHAGATARRLSAAARESLARRLHLVARDAVDGPRAGAHPGRRAGDGVAFAEHAPYHAGDDLRRIDWRAAARSDRLLVRLGEAERAVEVVLVIDASRSMAFGSVLVDAADRDAGGTKLETGLMAAAMLGYRWLAQGDRVRIVRAGDTVRRGPARSGVGQLVSLCRDLAGVMPADDERAALTEAVALGASSGVATCWRLVVTDALDPGEGWYGALADARAAGHPALVVHPVDPAERSLPGERPSRFVDPEGRHAIDAHPARIRASYRARFAEHLHAVRRRLLGAGVDHLVLDVGAPVGPGIGGYLAGRRGRGGARWG